LLKIARLPSVILNAFDSPARICEGWALDLIDALEDVERRQPTLRVARALAAKVPRENARDVYRQLIAAGARGRKLRPRAHDEVVKDHSGHPVFRIRRQSRLVAILVPVERVSAEVMDSVRTTLTDILQRASVQAQDDAGHVAIEEHQGVHGA
jgi:hypothetical protein